MMDDMKDGESMMDDGECKLLLLLLYFEIYFINTFIL